MEATVTLKSYLSGTKLESVGIIKPEIPEYIFEKITSDTSLKNMPLYYATIDGKVVNNYNNKKTYTSENKLIQGLKSTLSNEINRYSLGITKNFDNIVIDFNDIIQQLKENGRLVIHKLEYTEIN